MNKQLSFIILILSLGANAVISSESENYTSLCIEDNSVGFSWLNGSWGESTTFIGSKYIIKKFPYSKAPRMCDISKAAYNDIRTYGCYNIKNLGQEFGMFRYQLCTEFWEEGTLNKVRCDNSVWGDTVEFQPNGVFHMSKTDRNLGYADLKDSMYISYGKCSTM